MAEGSTGVERIGPAMPGRSSGEDPNLAMLRASIEQTEAAMSETLDAIQDRLSLEHLKRETEEQLVSLVAGKVQPMAEKANRLVENFGQSITQAVKENPVPFALAGIGLGWAVWRGVMSKSRAPSELAETPYASPGESLPEDLSQSGLEEVGGYAFEQSQGIQGRVQSALEGARTRLSEAADKAEQAVKRGVHRQGSEPSVTERRSSRSGWRETLGSNTVTLGFTAALIGVAIGLMLPESQGERRTLGEKRQRLIDRTREFGHQTVEKIESVAREARRAAVKEAEREHLPIGHNGHGEPS